MVADLEVHMKEALHKPISRGIHLTIKDHGNITPTLAGSAAKRVVNCLPQYFLTEVYESERVQLKGAAAKAKAERDKVAKDLRGQEKRRHNQLNNLYKEILSTLNEAAEMEHQAGILAYQSQLEGIEKAAEAIGVELDAD